MRADSKFSTADVVATAARYDAAVSVTTGSNPLVNAAIAQIPDTAWTAIHYPHAFVDTETGQLVSDAEIAEIGYTAFTSRPKNLQVTGRLIVRRVKRLNPHHAVGQQGLFDLWRHHAVFVTSRFETLQAEIQHRGHAVIEQVIADAAASALAHLPSGIFTANAAWAVLWAISHNLTRATAVLAGAFHARATTATIRAHLINVPARLARSARRVTLHLPGHWPWQPAWESLHTATTQRLTRPPPAQGPTGDHRGRAGQTGGPLTPRPRTSKTKIHKKIENDHSKPGRWIRAQGGVTVHGEHGVRLPNRGAAT